MLGFVIGETHKFHCQVAKLSLPLSSTVQNSPVTSPDMRISQVMIPIINNPEMSHIRDSNFANFTILQSQIQKVRSHC